MCTKKHGLCGYIAQLEEQSIACFLLSKRSSMPILNRIEQTNLPILCDASVFQSSYIGFGRMSCIYEIDLVHIYQM
ncbi:hypothetical protein BD560DRAFT_397090 [Blakeslea trispora]|nr:hypothetical protein BD560DRAFT_397090 [Blakeslea trispora]